MGNAVGNRTTRSIRESQNFSAHSERNDNDIAALDVRSDNRRSSTISILRNKLESKQYPLSIIMDQSSQTSLSHEPAVGNKRNDNTRKRKKLFIACFIAYLIVCFLMCTSTVAQSILLYLHVIRYPFGDLKDLQRFGLSHARNLNFTTEDGLTLHGYHLVPPSIFSKHSKPISTWNSTDFDYSIAHADKIVIYFHGNGATRAFGRRIDTIKHLSTTLDAHVISFDYRGFGDSAGWPSEHGTLLDSRAVAKWLHSVVTKYNTQSEGYCPEKKSFLSSILGKTKGLGSKVEPSMQSMTPRLFLYGHSLGSAIGTAITAELNQLSPHAVAGLILDCPFSTLFDAIESHPIAFVFRFFPLLKNLMLSSLKFKYNTSKVLPSIGTPVLLLHGQNDFKISPLNSLKLYHSAIESGHFVESGNLTFKECNNNSSVSSISRVGTNYIQLAIIPSANHDDVFKTTMWLELVPQFVNNASC